MTIIRIQADGQVGMLEICCHEAFVPRIRRIIVNFRSKLKKYALGKGFRKTGDGTDSGLWKASGSINSKNGLTADDENEYPGILMAHGWS